MCVDVVIFHYKERRGVVLNYHYHHAYTYIDKGTSL